MLGSRQQPWLQSSPDLVDKPTIDSKMEKWKKNTKRRNLIRMDRRSVVQYMDSLRHEQPITDLYLLFCRNVLTLSLLLSNGLVWLGFGFQGFVVLWFFGYSISKETCINICMYLAIFAHIKVDMCTTCHCCIVL